MIEKIPPCPFYRKTVFIMTTTCPTPEKRRFYRITDRVYLHIELINESSRPSPAQLIYPYINELRKIEAESKHQLYQLQNSDPPIAAYLQILNRKIECLGQAIMASHSDQAQEANHLIQLSEGGLSAELDQPFEPDTLCHAKMILYPHLNTLLFTAKVIYCNKLPKAESAENTTQTIYRIGFEFVQLNEGDAQLLARHIINIQSNNRRQQQLDKLAKDSQGQKDK